MTVSEVRVPTQVNVVQRFQRRFQREYLRVYDQAIDGLWGIQAYVPPLKTLPDPRDRNQPYEPMSHPGIARLSAALKLGPNDVFYDIGCGMGRVNCYFARQPIAKSVGVDIDEDLIRVADRNARTLKGARAPLVFQAKDGTLCDYSDGTVFLFYNPFGAEIMRQVIDRIDAERRGKPVRIVHAPMANAHIIDATPWLRRSGPEIQIPHYGHTSIAQIWEST